MSGPAIFKQALEPGTTTLKGYGSCRPISVGPDPSGTPCVWFEQNGNGNGCDVEIITVGTGHEFKPWGWQFIGTFLLPAEGLTWHCYWRARHR